MIANTNNLNPIIFKKGMPNWLIATDDKLSAFQQLDIR